MEMSLASSKSEKHFGTPQSQLPGNVSDMMDHALPSAHGRLSPDRPKSAHAHSACRKKYVQDMSKETKADVTLDKQNGQKNNKINKEVKVTKKQELMRTNQKHLAKDCVANDNEDNVSDMSLSKIEKKNSVKNQKFSKNTISQFSFQKNLNSPRSISEYSSGFQVSYKPLPVHLNNFYPREEQSDTSEKTMVDRKTNHNNGNKPEWDKKFRTIAIGSRIPVASYRTSKLKDGSLVLNTPRGDIKVIYPDDEEAYYKDLDPVEYFDDKSVWDLPLPSPAKTQKFTSGMTRINDVSESFEKEQESPTKGNVSIKQRPWSEAIPEHDKLLLNRKKCINTNNNIYTMFFENKQQEHDSVPKGSKVQSVAGFKGKTLKQNKPANNNNISSPTSKSPELSGSDILEPIPEEMKGNLDRTKKGDNPLDTKLAPHAKHEKPNKWTYKPEKQQNSLDKKYIQNSLSVRSYKPLEKKGNRRPFSDLNASEAETLKMRINGYQNVQLEDTITKYENMDQFRKAKPKFQRAPFRNAPQSEIGTPRGILMEPHGLQNKQHILQPRRLRPIKN